MHLIVNLFFIAILLAAYHYLVESFLVPVLRVKEELNLTILKEKTELLLNKKPLDPKSPYPLLNLFITTLLASLPELNFFQILLVITKIKKIQKQFDNFQQQIFHHDPEAKKIFNEACGYIFKASVINSLALFIPISIIVFILYIFFKPLSICIKGIKYYAAHKWEKLKQKFFRVSLLIFLKDNSEKLTNNYSV